MEWNQASFNKWIKLRERTRVLRAEKRYDEFILVCEKIISLGGKAPFIGIVIPLFHYDMARAYEKTGNFDMAFRFYNQARDGFSVMRSEKSKLAQPDDWLNDIGKIDRALQRIEKRKKTYGQSSQ